MYLYIVHQIFSSRKKVPERYIWQHESGIDQRIVSGEPLLHLVRHEPVDEQDGQVAVTGQRPAKGPAVFVLKSNNSLGLFDLAYAPMLYWVTSAPNITKPIKYDSKVVT